MWLCIYIKTNATHLAVMHSLTLTPFILDLIMCISPHLSVILNLFSIPSSLYLIMSIVSFLMPTHPPITAFVCYNNFGSCFDLCQVWLWQCICLSSINVSKFQTVLNAAAHLIGETRITVHWLLFTHPIKYLPLLSINIKSLILFLILLVCCHFY